MQLLSARVGRLGNTLSVGIFLLTLTGRKLDVILAHTELRELSFYSLNDEGYDEGMESPNPVSVLRSLLASKLSHLLLWQNLYSTTPH
jgi:hypothetical protein